jgi:hypothetical protein
MYVIRPGHPGQLRFMHVAWLAVGLARDVAYRPWTAETHAVCFTVGLACDVV